MIQAEKIRAAVEGYFAANNALDADAVADLFAPDAQMHRVPGTSPTEGREAIRQVYRQLLAAFSQSDVHAVHIFIAGNGAALLYRGMFTAKTGKAVTVEGIDVFEVNEDGQIQAIRFYWDPAPLAAVLRR
ncbi:MAG: nuclear transport factor 2 family protein [Thermomicrobiales bacterium]